jgi:CheY-like chemotaxis protein
MKRRGSRDNWKVLLAEDNDSHAILIQMALEEAASLPVEVHRARNGDEAIAMVEDLVPDLVLLDLEMPGRSGHEVLEAIKSDDELRHIPIAVLTSSESEADVARSYGLGGNHYITKVDDPAELKQHLRTVLKNVDEMSRIRRGSAGLEKASARTVRSGNRRVRWLALLAAIVALLAFAYSLGVL